MILIFILAYTFPVLFSLAKIALAILFLIVLIEWISLIRLTRQYTIVRTVPDTLSLHDVQEINYTIINGSPRRLKIDIVDELPDQIQERNFEKGWIVKAGNEETLTYQIRPTERGEYNFGNVYGFVSFSFPGFVTLRSKKDYPKSISVIPSILQMKKYELMTMASTATQAGIRRIRRVGENDEFEHIRAYTQGDNIKSINWKATSRRNEIMVNQYQDTRSQQVYCIIDKGRSMRQPFDGLTLLDYSINSSLVISNIVLKKFDKIGLVSFSHIFGNFLKASNKGTQLHRIAEHLYNEKTDFKESNLSLLHQTIRRRISQRSILFLFTNFENSYDMERSLAYLKAINRRHLLIVIFFENTALRAASESAAKSSSDIYTQTFARSTLVEKKVMARRLNKLGIQSILTSPAKLSVHVINKYLEIKAKRMR